MLSLVLMKDEMRFQCTRMDCSFRISLSVRIVYIVRRNRGLCELLDFTEHCDTDVLAVCAERHNR